MKFDIYNFREYQGFALRTEKTPVFWCGNHQKSRFAHGVIGICTEIGELQDQFKKNLIYGRELDPVNVVEELGDIAWYCALVCSSLDTVLGADSSCDGDLFNRTCHFENVTPEGLATMRLAATLYLGLTQAMLQREAWSLAAASGWEVQRREVLHAVDNILCASSNVLASLGYTWKDACERNIAKLARRFGDKFSEHAALNRDLDAERQELEKAERLVRAGVITPEAMKEAIDLVDLPPKTDFGFRCCERDTDGDGNCYVHPKSERKA